MVVTLKFIGDHAHLASEKDVRDGIIVAMEVFTQNNADPAECAAAVEKLEKDELLTKEEALLTVIWDTADTKAFKKVTQGWMIRDIDIRLAIGE
jgi:hypothetical protein